VRCRFTIIEKDGARWAWCEICAHGYKTDELDPAKHHRNCRPGRGVAGLQTYKLEPDPPRECTRRGLVVSGVMVESCCNAPPWKMAVYSCLERGQCTKDKAVDGIPFCGTCTPAEGYSPPSAPALTSPG